MTNDTAYVSLTRHLASCTDAEKISALLDALLTEKEKQELCNRMHIYDLLDRGLAQREIAKTLAVGIATVSRGARAHKIHDVSDLLATLRRERVDVSRDTQ